MSISDLFKSLSGIQTSPASAPKQEPSGTLPGVNPSSAEQNTRVHTSEGTAVNGVLPAGQVADNKTSPVDQFSKLWENDQVDPNAEVPNNWFNIDPAKLHESASKSNFTKSISPELLAKVAAGGEDAIAAFTQAFQAFGADMYTQQTLTSAKMMEQALAQAEQKFGSKVPSMVKAQQVKSAMTNEAYKNPAFAPILDAVQSRIIQKFPNATASEVETMVTSYMDNFAKTVAPTKQAEQTPQTNPTTDNWDWMKG